MVNLFNIANYLTLKNDFESMLGFTQEEMETLLNQVYQDYPIPEESRKEVGEVAKSQYNGYRFIDPEGNETDLIQIPVVIEEKEE